MAVRLRPRSSWEALDLGLALARQQWRQVYGAWFAVYLPAVAIANLVFDETPFWAWLALWWLKPFFDRIVLAVLAPAMFGEPVRVWPLVKSLPRIAWRSRIVGALLWRRLDLARSLHLPVYQLEQLHGKPARSRIRVLDRDARGAAVWLTFMLANVEMLIALGVSLGLAFLVPVQAPLDTMLEAWARGTFSSEGARAGALLGAAAVCLTEPLYVAAGFTLYLQRRTHLEGWDIELRFRQLTERVAAAAAAATLALCLAIGPVHEARAEAKDPAAEIRSVLADPEFGHEDTVRHLKYIGPTTEPKEQKAPDFSWLEGFAKFIAQATRAAAWIAGAAAIGFALYYLARYLRLRGFARAKGARPDFLFGMDVRAASLPADIAGTAQALAREGRLREALSLLYRGALVRFMDDGVEFLAGDTEGDCLRRVDAAASVPRRSYFHRIVALWQSLAYAHRPVDARDVEALAVDWNAA
jgi:uncharacterized protein DUF4129